MRTKTRTHKICSGPLHKGALVPLAEFGPHGTGMQSFCRVCKRSPEAREANARHCAVYYENHKAQIISVHADYRAENLVAHAARRHVMRLVKRGVLIYDKCVICGSTENQRFHHADYTEPDQVHNLCQVCHSKVHKGEITLTGLRCATLHWDVREKVTT